MSRNFIPSVIPIYIFGIVIGIFGAAQILNAGNMVDSVPSFLPAPKMFIYITGAALLLVAVSFIIDRFARLAGYLLAVLLLIIIFTLDIPGAVTAPDHAIRSLFVTITLKDLAIAMAAIIIGNLSKHS